MPELQTLRQNDEALKEMYKGDTQGGEPLSAGDEQAYRGLIEEQRNGFQDTFFEKKAEDGTVTTGVAASIGEAALHNPLTPAQADRAQFESAAEDWHNTQK